MFDKDGLCFVPQTLAGIAVDWPGTSLSLGFVPPRVNGRSTGDRWQHESRREELRSLAGGAGAWVCDTFATDGLRLEREVWISETHREVALRYTLTNLADDEVSLNELSPLHCYGIESLRIDGKTAGEWEVLRQATLKNEIPAAVRLGTFDEDYRHAVYVIGEQGDLPTDGHGQSVRVKMDSFGVLRPTDPASRTNLLVGLLSQRDHLACIELETDSQRRRLERLTARCLFDGCRLPSGGRRSSQWVVVMGGDAVNPLVHRFADRVGRYHGVATPTQRPPAVWCSWYYYGPRFYEADLHAELGFLKANRLPFDVLLIDDSRPRPWGDWFEHDRWPSGMKDAAERIAALGYQPGLWTCPLLANTESALAAEHPNWLLKRDDGRPVIFEMEGTNYVLDPTCPDVELFLERLLRTMTDDWGFTYHKLDFMRAVLIDPRCRYHDPHVTRLEAYQRALAALRRGAGPDAYISVCGGHYGGSIGLADSQRSGADVVGCWDDPPALPAIKQNLLRTWMNRLWHTDADSMMVRRRSEPIDDSIHGRLSLGRFTDEEARTIAANQYVAGGILCATESFRDIDADRLSLYRHVLPTLGNPGTPLDPMNPRCPSIMVNPVKPRCDTLAPWVTVTLFNWEDEPADLEVRLAEAVDGMNGARWLVTEFFSHDLLGVMRRNQTAVLKDVPPHACRILRLAPWLGEQAMLGGTDLHFSGGGVEVSAWRAGRDCVAGEIDTPWHYPVRVMVAFPDAGQARLRSVVVGPNDRRFRVRLDSSDATATVGAIPAVPRPAVPSPR